MKSPKTIKYKGAQYRLADASFDKLYDTLVETLRKLEGEHGMDPQRIADQAVLTLKGSKGSKE